MKLFLALLLLLASPALGDQAIVRVDVDPPLVTVGQAVQLRVTVLVPTWFGKPPELPSFEVANAITSRPPDSSYPTSERVDGQSWSGVVREYVVYPLMAGRFQLPAQAMDVVFADPGKPEGVSVVAQVPPIEFRATVPAGAEGLDPFLSATSLSLDRSFAGDTESLEAGDAVVARVVARVEGMTALFLPPLVSPDATSGLSIYPKEPVVEDGRREETVTYVFDKPGRYVLPPISLRWWNTRTQRIETTRLPEVKIVVEGLAAALAGPRGSLRDWPAHRWLILALFAVCTGAAYRFRSALLVGWARAWSRWLASEEYAFRAVRRAASAGDPAVMYEKTLVWLDRLQPEMTTSELAMRSDDAELGERLADLSRSLYEGGVSTLDLVALGKSMARARRQLKEARRRARQRSLPPLNPV